METAKGSHGGASQEPIVTLALVDCSAEGTLVVDVDTKETISLEDRWWYVPSRPGILLWPYKVCLSAVALQIRRGSYINLP